MITEDKIVEEKIVEEEVTNTPVEEVSEAPKEKLSKKERKEKRQQKRIAKLRKKMLNPVDIKYRGPFSYRHLRLLAWIAIAISQLILLNSISTKMFDLQFLNSGWEYFISCFADLTTPLFVIAAFATILNGSRSFKSMIIFYAVAYIGLGAAISIAFDRYFLGLLASFSEYDQVAMSQLVGNLAGKKVQMNVFSDLLFLTLFHFFVNYHPTKFFQGKKVYIFRWLCLVPLLIAIAGHVIKGLASAGSITLPLEVYVFLPTKSPFIYFIFVTVSLWIKNRERLFLKLGSSREEYQAFLKTNRNSLSFSLKLSSLLAIFSVVDLVASLAFLIIHAYATGVTDDFTASFNLMNACGLGQSTGLFIAIPFIILFSYTREHKDTKLDLLLPVIGIALLVLVYVEGFYQVLTHMPQTA